MYIRTVPKEIKDMLRKIANNEGYDYDLIEDVYFHEFEFIANKMSIGNRRDFGTYENILVKYLGSFIANEKHINKLVEITDAKKNKDIEVSE